MFASLKKEKKRMEKIFKIIIFSQDSSYDTFFNNIDKKI